MSERVIAAPEIAPDEVEEYWRQNANCLDVDPDLFFPVGTVHQVREQTKAAKAICRMCIVQGSCLEYAMVNREEHGIWGGMSEDERVTYHKTWLANKTRSNLTF